MATEQAMPEHICQAWRLEDGDLLVVRVDHKLSEEAVRRMRESFGRLAERLGKHFEIVVLEEGVSLACAKEADMHAGRVE